jgi:hypothetical protein
MTREEAQMTISELFDGFTVPEHLTATYEAKCRRHGVVSTGRNNGQPQLWKDAAVAVAQYIGRPISASELDAHFAR